MVKKDKEPPPPTLQGGSEKDLKREQHEHEKALEHERKERERHERERLRKINKVPDYEALFRETESTSKKRKGEGFLKKIFRRDRKKIFLSMVLYVIKASPIWILPLVTSDVIDLITLRPPGYVQRILIDALLYAILLIQNVPMHTWQASITDKMLRNTTAGIKRSVVRKLQRLSITYHKEMESGAIQSKFLRDIDSVDVYYRNVVNNLLPNIIGAVIAIVISLYKSPLVTLFFVAIIPLNVINVRIFRKRIRMNYSEFRKENELLSTKLTTMLQMLTLTKAHGLETVETVSMQKRINSLTNAGLRLDKTNAYFGSLNWVISNLLAGACLFFCVFLALKGYITAGDVVLFQSMFTSINASVMALVSVFPALSSGREAVQSLSEIMRSEDMENPGGAGIVPALEGKIDFNCISYRYPNGDKDVVKNFDLHVHKGECIAIVGSSGSGKSTIINLLIGLLEPTEGEILVDGRSLKNLPMQSYRHYISVVPQNSILFAGTIRENITYGLDFYTEKEFERVLEEANVNEFLPSLPDGVATQVGEHGDKLSGGQRQRICIARALIRNPRILILDEATSALDNVSEFHVQKAVNRLIEERTTFIVAHRLSTIRNADRIVVMENGEMVECGSYEELMALGGKFCELEKLSRIHEEATEE